MLLHFLLLIHAEGGGSEHVPPEDLAKIMAAVEAFDAQITAEGRNLGSIRLQPAATAKILRNVNGQRLVTDGPFADTKEHLGGLWIIDAADMDEALAVAGRLPDNAFATIEVRPATGVDLRGFVRTFVE